MSDGYRALIAALFFPTLILLDQLLVKIEWWNQRRKRR